MLVSTQQLVKIECRLLPLFVLLADRSHECSVTISNCELARELKRTPRAVMRNMRELERTGYVIRENVAGQANKYKILLEQLECLNE